MLDFASMTWRCMVCGDTRPDDAISVRTWPVEYKGEIMPGGAYNLKFCNDRPECIKAAETHGPYRIGAS